MKIRYALIALVAIIMFAIPTAMSVDYGDIHCERQYADPEEGSDLYICTGTNFWQQFWGVFDMDGYMLNYHPEPNVEYNRAVPDPDPVSWTVSNMSP